jgi:hypothetical protein
MKNIFKKSTFILNDIETFAKKLNFTETHEIF